jgi:hypothetical protein
MLKFHQLAINLLYLATYSASFQEPVVVVPVRVVPLIPGHLAHRGHQAHAGRGMTLVAPGLHLLGEAAPVQVGNGVHDGAVASAVLEITDSLAHLCLSS